MQNSCFKICLVLGVWVTSLGQAYGRGMGFGLIFSDIQGLTWKNQENQDAWELHLGWKNKKKEDRLEIVLAAQKLWLYPNFFKIESIYLGAYFGLGVKLNTEEKVGLRVPLGVHYFLHEIPLEIFVALVPAMQLYPSTTGQISLAFGLRYFFS